MGRAWLAMFAILATLYRPCTAQPEAPGPGAAQFEFAVLSARPNAARDDGDLRAAVAAVDDSGVAFAIHLGSIAAAGPACGDESLEARLDIIMAAQRPWVVLPGQFDWVDCGLEHDETADPLERLARFRDVFAHGDAFGQEHLALARESALRRFPGFPENVRWQYRNTLFVGLNLPGDNGAYRVGAGRNGEFEDRVIANRVWLEYAFRFAESQNVSLVVIAVSGDPQFGRPLRPPDQRLLHRDGFYEFKAELRELAARFRGNVLVIHSADRLVMGDHPLMDALGRPLRNVERVAVAPDLLETGRWLEITIRPHAARPVTTRLMILPPAAHEPPANGAGPGVAPEN